MRPLVPARARGTVTLGVFLLGLSPLAACGGGDENVGSNFSNDSGLRGGGGDAAQLGPVGNTLPVSDGGTSAVSVASEPPRADAGTAPTDASISSPASTWCTVQPLFAKYCASCHDGMGTAGSPMPLLAHTDLAADSKQFPGSKVYTRVGARMNASSRPMPPQGGVSAADQKLIDDWIAAGAPAGTSTMCGAAVNPGADAGVAATEWPADCEDKYKFVANAGAGKPFQVAAGSEFYQDFTFTAPWSGDVQAVAFRNITDNKKVIHHWILYQGQSSFLVGWSPGKNEKELPPDVGVHMPASGSLKLTAHYFNALPGAKAETDASGVEVCVSKKKRPKTAFTMPFAANPSIPANAQNLENADTCTVQSTEPVHLITSSPHMHKLGVHAKFTVQRGDGKVEVIHDLPFNFEEQTTRNIDVVLNNGDKVTTTCVYTNTTNQSVGFGQKTDQEMCFNFSLYYPMCAMKCTPSNFFAAAIHSSQGAGCPTGGS